MPIDLSNLSADDIAAATAAVEAARGAREERERREAEEQRKRQEEERACQEATMQREAEERKVAAVRKAEGSLGLREGGTGRGGGGRTATIACNGALWPQTHHSGLC
jgi:hypothetical protein